MKRFLKGQADSSNCSVIITVGGIVDPGSWEEREMGIVPLRTRSVLFYSFDTCFYGLFFSQRLGGNGTAQLRGSEVGAMSNQEDGRTEGQTA